MAYVSTVLEYIAYLYVTDFFFVTEVTMALQLDFTSFNPDDEDYRGYEYSLFGELSEVRIVYLNRFVQEVPTWRCICSLFQLHSNPHYTVEVLLQVISYFMGLVPSNANSVVKLKDQATNSEKWFTTTEIEGSPALKLDLSLKKPIIVMPQRTNSLK